MDIKELREHVEQNYPRGETKINISVTYHLKFGPEGAAFIAQTITWPISEINLSIYFIQNEGMQSIIKAGQNWPTLTSIRLEKNNITCDGLKNIQNVSWLHLKKINLNKNNIKAKGFEWLTKAKWPQLQIFQLSHSQMGLEGAMHFRNINWPKLQSLNLNFNLIGLEGARLLSKCNFPLLRTLELTNNRIQSKGVFYLSRMELPNLESLNLSRNSIGRDGYTMTEIGCVYLSKMKVKALHALHIFGNDITLIGIKQILYCGKFVQNAFLELVRNLFTFEEIEQDLLACKLFSNKF